jgi:DNA primase
MDTAVQDVKSRLNIVDVVSAYLRLVKSGTHFKAPCPFHNEKTPSFMVNEERQIWHCFGCGKGGDAFSFIMEIEGVEFGEALKLLAERSGVDLRQYRRERPLTAGEVEVPDRTRDILELSTKFYEKQLWDGAGKERIIGYLRKRGLTDETIRSFRIGYAPEGWRHLLDFLVSRGYRPEELEKAGLVIRKSQEDQVSGINHPASSSYDRFRDRVMFPISDIVGRVIGYSARVAPGGDETQAKYINTPETGVYHKSRVLYGLYQAKQTMKTEEYAILVEGQMDVIACHQAGIKNTVAVSGTALTGEHLDILKRYGHELRLFFDMDGAGQAAAWKSALLAFDREFSVSIISLPAGKDAAEAAVENPETLKTTIAHPKPAAAYFLEKFLAEHDAMTPDGKRAIAERYAPLLQAMRSAIERDHWTKECANALHVEEKLLSDVVQKENAQERGVRTVKQVESVEGKSVFARRSAALQERLIGVLLVRPELKEVVLSEPRAKESVEGSPFFRFVGSGAEGISLAETEAEKKKLSELFFEAEQFLDSLPESEEAQSKTEASLREMARHLALELQKEEREETVFLMGEARKRGDRKEEKKLMERFAELSHGD